MSFQQRVFMVSLLLIGLLALAGCGGGAPLQPTVIRITATPGAALDTPVPATQEPALGAEATPPAADTPAVSGETAATATSAPEAAPATGEETVVFEFESTLSTVEEIEDIRDLLIDTEGILAITGTEVSVRITYDPDVFTVAELFNLMNQIGYPVKPP